MDKTAEPSLQPEWLSKTSGLASHGDQKNNTLSGGLASGFPSRRSSTSPNTPPTAPSSSISAFPIKDYSSSGRVPIRPPTNLGHRSLIDTQTSPPAPSPVVVRPANQFDKNFPALGNNSPWKDLANQDSSRYQPEKQPSVWSAKGPSVAPSSSYTTPTSTNAQVLSRSITLNSASLSPRATLASKTVPIAPPLGAAFTRSVTLSSTSIDASPPPLPPVAPVSPPTPPPPPPQTAAAIVANGIPSMQLQPPPTKSLTDSVQREILQKLVPKSSSWTVGAKTLKTPSRQLAKPDKETSALERFSAVKTSRSLTATPASRLSASSGLTVISKPKSKDEDTIAVVRPVARVGSTEEVSGYSAATSRFKKKSPNDTQKGDNMKWLQQLRKKDGGEDREKSRSPESDVFAEPLDGDAPATSTTPSPDTELYQTEPPSPSDKNNINTNDITVTSIHKTLSDKVLESPPSLSPPADAYQNGVHVRLAIGELGQLQTVDMDSLDWDDDEFLKPEQAELDMLLRLGWNPYEKPLTEEEKAEWLKSNGSSLGKHRQAFLNPHNGFTIRTNGYYSHHVPGNDEGSVRSDDTDSDDES
mmetsp:Transcript_32907/g.53403  ORF Transcript_32907/g.53403 Transcript_32907/m.53403 type:complete len:585 (+) Transcript_32907:360-2114(+)|eukprot:CAMPEP_0184654274 /NCGR_PEP_ID=MMETSP0308-20130426/11964_1 /TAXON_ID=38269 /ORGANISM="Gloeochaete witrockiana, Strain SAG 46.84" /LENGTH=584 /DNA_ID=CAMNT_0027090193 /DNA_START=356 /DNA_END=2110 /DNA_ORIENTATION=-